MALKPCQLHFMNELSVPLHAQRCVALSAENRHIPVHLPAKVLITIQIWNERAVGDAIKTCGVPREELFIITKLWVQDAGYDNTLKAFETSRKNLGLDYIDLYLIHQPFGDYYRGLAGHGKTVCQRRGACHWG